MITLIRLIPYILVTATIFAYQQGVESERLKWIQKEQLEQLQINDIREKQVQSLNEEHEKQKESLSNIINDLVIKNEKLNSNINASRSNGLYVNRKAICENRMSAEANITSGSSQESGVSDTIQLPETLERELRRDYESAAKLASDCGILLDYAQSVFEIK